MYHDDHQMYSCYYCLHSLLQYLPPHKNRSYLLFHFCRCLRSVRSLGYDRFISCPYLSHVPSLHSFVIFPICHIASNITRRKGARVIQSISSIPLFSSMFFQKKYKTSHASPKITLVNVCDNGTKKGVSH
eukprot:Pompholyxophrys_sp_v1_NODE_59_length_2791_cov_2.606360.p3 type:complete len:130 gc:universal NODE_59_length_2791_cov_2.606360:921-532(-)